MQRDEAQHRRFALVIGSPVGRKDFCEGVRNSSERIAEYLERSGFRVLRVLGADATRSGIEQGIRWLKAYARSGGCVVLYFAGHGYVIDDSGLSTSGDIPPAYHQMLIPVDIKASTIEDFRGILSIELGAWVEELAAITKNVTVILDCCHAAQMAVAQRALDAEAHEDWKLSIARQTLAKWAPHFREAAPEHAGEVVRLIASTALERSYPYQRRDGSWGLLFTDYLVESLSEQTLIGLPWSQIIAWIRGRVWEHEPGQRPDVAGARYRRPFLREEAGLPDGVFFGQRAAKEFVIETAAPGAVALEDVFELVPADSVDPSCSLASARAVKVSPTRAWLELHDTKRSALLPRAFHAVRVHRAMEEPRGVCIVGLPSDASSDLSDALVAWGFNVLSPGIGSETSCIATLDVRGGFTLRDNRGAVRFHTPSKSQAGILSLRRALRRLVRWRQLERVIDRERIAPNGHGYRLRLGCIRSGQREWLADKGATVFEGDELFVQVERSASRPIFASLFRVAGDRALHHWTRNAPAGVPIVRGSTRVLGAGQYEGVRGVSLMWPRYIPAMLHTDERLLVVVADGPASFHELAIGQAPRVSSVPDTSSPMCFGISVADTMSITEFRYTLISRTYSH